MKKVFTDITILIRLHDGDKERLQKLYPSSPYNAVIRNIVKSHLDSIEAKLDRISGRAPRVKETDFE